MWFIWCVDIDEMPPKLYRFCSNSWMAQFVSPTLTELQRLHRSFGLCSNGVYRSSYIPYVYWNSRSYFVNNTTSRKCMLPRCHRPQTHVCSHMQNIELIWKANTFFKTIGADVFIPNRADLFVYVCVCINIGASDWRWQPACYRISYCTCMLENKLCECVCVWRHWRVGWIAAFDRDWKSQFIQHSVTIKHRIYMGEVKNRPITLYRIRWKWKQYT